MVRNDRNLVKYIILTIITCGIYHWVFMYYLAEDMNVVCDGDEHRTPGLWTFLLLSIVTYGIYGLYWYYKVGNRMAENAPRYHMQFKEKGITILLWMSLGSLICGLGPLVAMHILIKNMNALAGAYNYVYYGKSDIEVVELLDE